MGKIQMLQESMKRRIDGMKQEASIAPLLAAPAVYGVRASRFECSKAETVAAHRWPLRCAVFCLFFFFCSTKFLIEPVKSRFPRRETSLQLVHFKFDVRTSSTVVETAFKRLLGEMMQRVRTDRMQLGGQDCLAKLRFKLELFSFFRPLFFFFFISFWPFR